MLSSTRNGGSVNVSPHQDDLQREIEEKQRELKKLYERRRRNVRALRLPQHNLDVAETRDVPQLRIRGSPAPRRQPDPAALSTPPLGGMGPPESIIAITSERRRFYPRTIPENCDSFAAAGAAQSMLSQNRPSPSREFAARLSRLHKASVAGSATMREAAAVAATHGPLSDSLAVSPIVTEFLDGQAYASPVSYLRSISALFESCGVVSCVDGGGAEGGRHVRFSSHSPQVATFSVERSSAPLQEELTATAGTVTATPPRPAAEVKRLTPGSELDLVQTAPSAHPCITSPWVSTLVISPFMPSGNSSCTPPRAGATSSLAEAEELRSSVLLVPLDTRHSVRSFNADSCFPVQPRRNQKTCEVPSVMNAKQGMGEQEDRGGCSTPRRQGALEYSCDLGESVGAVAASVSSTTVSGAFGLTGPVIQGSPATAAMPEAFEHFAETSPIFLRRPVRRPERPIHHSCLPPFSNITNQLQQSSPLPSPRSQESGHRSTAAASKTAKKCVRFRESVERADKGAAGALFKRRRPGWRLAHPSASPPAVVGVPIIMPVKLCCEQEGFGASILLACGPTLYFD
ncbi:hypothetical protein GH5_03082 [Leishmania sp. Ghana 2012 LV757]|uniref:hypothetical protein n=1 Tax=Leishmania sp. Ghana 2012 LV757 TaxID=2803181 RepID=UPI001B5E4791|nr:hypothetical protein GH5_03082 [Leishmania sp. Ghana 2012 LV757]